MLSDDRIRRLVSNTVQLLLDLRTTIDTSDPERVRELLNRHKHLREELRLVGVPGDSEPLRPERKETWWAANALARAEGILLDLHLSVFDVDTTPYRADIDGILKRYRQISGDRLSEGEADDVWPEISLNIYGRVVEKPADDDPIWADLLDALAIVKGRIFVRRSVRLVVDPDTYSPKDVAEILLQLNRVHAALTGGQLEIIDSDTHVFEIEAEEV